MRITEVTDHHPQRCAVRRWLVIGSLGGIVFVAAACSSSASSPTSTVLKQRTTASHSTPPVVSAAPAGTLGTILVDQSGFTLYRFSPDGTGKTTCTGSCAAAWPPLTVPSSHLTAGTGITASELGTITRPDGSLQVTFNGLPLYRFSGDKKAGDTGGQGVAGDWFVVPASASAPAAPSTTTSAPPSTTTAPTSPPTGTHSVPQNTGNTVAPAPAATAPPTTAPPTTAPPMTAPPTSSPPTTPAGGYGY